MANYIKKELEYFDYNKKYYVPNEHRWCGLSDDKTLKKLDAAKLKLQLHEPATIQGNPEITGQKLSL